MKKFLLENKKDIINNLIALLIGLATLCIGAVIYYTNNYVSALFIVLLSIGTYFYTQFFVVNKNWLDVTACFSLVWAFTIGLSALRLLDYQKEWETLTWVSLILAYFVFYVGSYLGKTLVKAKIEKIENKKISVKGYTLKRQDGRLFWICFAVTVFAIICFALNVYIRRFIPFFSDSVTAYLDFYTPFYIFITAGSMISGLCYYVLIKQWQKLSVWKKVFLIFSIVYSTFFIPTIVVSRGMLLTSALSLTCVMFYLHKRKFVVVVLSLIVIAGFYAVGTVGRGYSDAQLDEIFEPSEIEKPSEEEGESGEVVFRISGKLAFVYSYFTVSHDNFNEAVLNNTEFTYGLRQIAPLFGVIKIGSINDKIENLPTYLVRDHLTTINLVGDAYYDFGIVGVAVTTLIWAFVFGAIQAWATKGDKPFGLLALGNTLSPVILCFFSKWMSLFSHWMHWGLILIMFLVACITKEKKNEISPDTESEKTLAVADTEEKEEL